MCLAQLVFNHTGYHGAPCSTSLPVHLDAEDSLDFNKCCMQHAALVHEMLTVFAQLPHVDGYSACSMLPQDARQVVPLHL